MTIALWVGGFLVVLALVAAGGAAVLSLHTWQNAPGARLWLQLRTRIEDLEAEREEEADRRAAARAARHTAARQENAAKATAARVEKAAARRTALEEAEELLANQVAAVPPGQQPLPGVPPVDLETAQYMALRKRAGLH